MPIKWNTEKVSMLKKMLNHGASYTQMAQKFSCTKSAIKSFCYNNGLKYNHVNHRAFDDKSITLLKKMLNDGASYGEIASKFCRNKHVIKDLCYSKGLKYNHVNPRSWDDKSITLLKKMLNDGASYEQIASKFGRTKDAIKKLCYSKGLKYNCITPNHWDDKDMKLLEYLVGLNVELPLICKIFKHKTIDSLRHKIYDIKIRKKQEDTKCPK